MPCRCCGTDRDLIKAHIIPEAFFRRLRDEGSVPRLLSNNESEYPKRIPVGVYDPGILCADCEQIFGPWDQYAVALLRDDLPGARVVRQGERILAHEIDDWQYDKLKLFFISVAWRASVSSQAMFKRVRLGPYEARARQMLVEGQPGSASEFCVVLSRFDPSLGAAIMDPFTARNAGTNYLRFYLGTFMADIAVDRRALPAPLPQLALQPGEPLRIVERELHGSPELPILRDIATKPKNIRYRPSAEKPAG
jgi:hypothetical protein